MQKCLLLLITLPFAMTAAFAETQNDCEGPFNGQEVSEEQLRDILLRHNDWVMDVYLSEGDYVDDDDRRANLCGAVLRGATLNGALLSGANLRKAIFDGADLSNAEMRSVDLRGGSLNAVNLRGARLTTADLRGAKLTGADLSGASIAGSNLTGAKMLGANLTGADLGSVVYDPLDPVFPYYDVLTNTNLSQTDLARANLSGANLAHADLSQAYLSETKLNSAYLGFVNLTASNLSEADLSKADLRRATLVEVDLTAANLSGANLSGADLSMAILDGTNVRDVELSGANLTRVLYEARSAPDNSSISNLRGLSTIVFRTGEQDGVSLLINKLQEAGLRELEREAIFALKKQQTSHKLAGEYGVGGKVDGAFNWLLFQVSTAWGMDPGRALWLIAALVVIFTPIYWQAIVKPSQDGIWRVWSEERRRQDLGQDDGDQPIQLHGTRAWRTAFYFSLLSAFHIGWRDMNVGNWMARVQKYEYTLRATGWARTVSGVQSLLSVYLLALWALTYFGRPFQ